MAQDKVFAKGIYPKEVAFPNGKITKLSIKKEEFQDWLHDQAANDKGYVNLNVKTSQNGKMYVELDTWKPSGNGSITTTTYPQNTATEEGDLPF